jgi:hypothetical protein
MLKYVELSLSSSTRLHDPVRRADARLARRGASPPIRTAVAAVVAEGQVRTYDMLKLRGGAQAIAQGAATTSQMTDAIIGSSGPWPRRSPP